MAVWDAVFGRRLSCACGKVHEIDPRTIVLDDDWADRLPGELAGIVVGRRVAVLADGRTRAVAGTTVAGTLRAAGWDVVEVLIPDRPIQPGHLPFPGDDDDLRLRSPVCDDTTYDVLVPELTGVDTVVAVGGGVINDLAKWFAWDRDLPYACVATAASMNGYASANIAPTIAGIKTLRSARPPRLILAGPAMLGAAPALLTAAGLGDILAKSVSAVDWRLNHLLWNDYYCARSVGLVGEIESFYLDDPAGIRDRHPPAITALFQGLLLTGAAMTMAETSSPSSGGEHMISHTLDMMAQVDGALHDFHGRQVGIGTVIASELYRRVLAIDEPCWREPDERIDAAFWGPLAGEVEREHAGKRSRLAQVRSLVAAPGAWDRLRADLLGMTRLPEVTRDCLRRAGAAYRRQDIGCDRPRLLAALNHAHEIRSRVTILDLARLVGVLPDAADDLIDTWT